MLSERINSFNRSLDPDLKLPRNIRVMNPFKDNPEVLEISQKFYNMYYFDSNPRKMILGINPGRLGAGQTGIPFTDSKRLEENCGFEISSVQTHEPSSVFVYKVIEAYGSIRGFYRDFYINSVCPLGFLEQNNKGNWINCNYYDYPELFSAVKEFCVDSLKKQLDFGMDASVCYVLGKKNAVFLSILNEEYSLFGKLVPLYHPRYIVQYKAKYMNDYVEEFLQTLK